MGRFQAITFLILPQCPKTLPTNNCTKLTKSSNERGVLQTLALPNPPLSLSSSMKIYRNFISD